MLCASCGGSSCGCGGAGLSSCPGAPPSRGGGRLRGGAKVAEEAGAWRGRVGDARR